MPSLLHLVQINTKFLAQPLHQRPCVYSNGSNSCVADGPFHACAQEAALVAVAAEVTEALRSKGPGGQHSESLSTLLGLLASLTDSSSPVAQQYMTSASSAVNPDLHGAAISNSSSHADVSAQETHPKSHGAPAAAMEVISASGAVDQKRKSDSSEERPQQRAAKAYAAGALVQAALNAMAAGVQGPQPLTFLTPTSSAAAAIAVQVRTPAAPSLSHGSMCTGSRTCGGNHPYDMVTRRGRGQICANIEALLYAAAAEMLAK